MEPIHISESDCPALSSPARVVVLGSCGYVQPYHATSIFDGRIVEFNGIRGHSHADQCDQLTPCTNCAKRNLACEYRSLEVPLPTSATQSNGPPNLTGGSYDDAEKRRHSSSASTSYPASHTGGFVPNFGGFASAGPGPRPGEGNASSTSASQTQASHKRTASTSHATGPPPEADTGFEEVNRHTHGTEYYGPVSLFSFLKRLRSRAHTQKMGIAATPGRSEPRSTRDARDMSIVNLLHSSDYPVTSPTANSPDQHRQSFSNHASPPALGATPSTSAPIPVFERTPSSSLPAAFPKMSNQDIERECIRLYFVNLHVIHPILDQARFLERCETDIWSKTPTREPCHNSFLALFNAIAAVGAIQAGEDASFMRDTSSVRQAERYAASTLPGEKSRDGDRQAPTYPPLMLAKLFFERAKVYLGDVFEACSLETTQTLFFMAIFCQNALKPHSCYLYCGMAVRGALAIGLPSHIPSNQAELVRASATWWGLYSLEIEMCAAAGRESSLRSPEHYRLPLPHIVSPEDGKQLFQSRMVELVGIVAELAAETSDPEWGERVAEKSVRCLEIDEKICKWKESLPASLDWEASSLVEPEWISKQKVVLRNRFLNTRLLIHRPFLIAAASSDTNPEGQNAYTVHVTACVAASVLTIETLYEMYKHRPYFRTWWYNTTYTLYASMVLLYVILSNIDVEAVGTVAEGGVDGVMGRGKGERGYSREYLLKTVGQSVEIFQAMDMVAVARRCVEVTQEVLEIAKRSQNSSAAQDVSKAQTQASGANTAPATGPPTPAPTSGANMLTPGVGSAAWDGLNFPGFDNEGLDFLIDSNLMDGLGGSFAGFGGMDGNGLDFMDFNSVLGGNGTGFV